jgi:sulfur relay protein TusB/DsrH
LIVVLHTLNASPAKPAFNDCVALLRQADAIILMGDGVYSALAGTRCMSQLLARTTHVYILRDDAAAAGVLDSLGDVTVINMEGFVELSERYARQLAWF